MRFVGLYPTTPITYNYTTMYYTMANASRREASMMPSIQIADLDKYNNHSTPSTNSNEERSDEPPWEKLCGANSIWFEARSADEPLDTLVIRQRLVERAPGGRVDTYRSEASVRTCVVQHFVHNTIKYNQIHLIKVQHIYKLGLEEVRYSV